MRVHVVISAQRDENAAYHILTIHPDDVYRPAVKREVRRGTGRPT